MVCFLIFCEYKAFAHFNFVFGRPLLTLSILLLLPSIMTLTTLLIHRIRQARAERLERAPEDVVAGLPTGVWTGEGCEFDDSPGSSATRKVEKAVEAQAQKEEGTSTVATATPAEDADPSVSFDLPVSAPTSPVVSSPLSGNNAAGSSPPTTQPPRKFRTRNRRYLKKAWFAAQTECAICLSDFEKGDVLRILPCGHIFHKDEVDGWLIQRKKLVRFIVPLFDVFV